MAYLIVGLGNPGSEYQNTRHSLGFEAVSAFAKKHQMQWKKNSHVEGYIASGAFDGIKIYLLMPMTYMNNSGRAVRLSVDYYQIDISKVLIIVDDAALPFGQFRFRTLGSSGGHNGLKSIEESLQTSSYARLRLGIGSDSNLKDYVLSTFTKEESKALEDLLPKSVEYVEYWLKEGSERAMNKINVPMDDKS